MSLEKWFKSGELKNPCTPLGLQIGRDVAASARRYLARRYYKRLKHLGRRTYRGLIEADHILMHVERGDGTCSQCPAYLIGNGARRA
jgi:hypothetical protein